MTGGCEVSFGATQRILDLMLGVKSSLDDVPSLVKLV